MKFFYMPFAVIAGVIGQRAGRKAFRAVWSRVGGETEEPPSPKAGRLSLVRVAGSAALEAATIAGIAAAVQQLTARVFHHLFGAWPEQPKEPDGSPADDPAA